MPQDHEILDRFVMVVDVDNRISGPHRTDDVLRRLDPAREILRVVSRGNPQAAAAARGPGDGDDAVQAYTVCKVVDKAADFAAERQRREKQKADRRDKKGRTKEMELNWAIGAHDLQHKLDKIVELLGKGYRVEVLLAKKRQSRIATEQEAQELLTKVKEAVERTGGRQWKENDGKVLKTLKMFFEKPKTAE